MNFKEAEGMIGRWLQLLSEFHFTVVHRQGKYHQNADALSRIPPRRCPREDCPNCYPDVEDINWMTIYGLHESICPERQIHNECFSGHMDEIPLNAIQSVVAESASDSSTDQIVKQDGGWTLTKLKQEQDNDPDIQSFKRLLLQYPEGKPAAKLLSAESKDVKIFYSNWDQYFLEKGILYKSPEPANRTPRYVVPISFRKQVMYFLHRNPLAGHMGMKRTINAAVRRFYWPRMRADLQRYVKTCLRCEMSKPGPGKGKSGLKQEIAGYRNERIAFDIVGPFPVSRQGNKYLLTIGDYFTKYFVAVPLPNHTAPTVAKAIFEQWICRLGGCPTTIHSDRAPEFVGKVLTHLWEMLGIHATRTLPYRPQSDGLVERFNSTIKSMLKCAVGRDKSNWDAYLPALMMAYNATQQASTGCTPNLLCFGEELVLPVDLMFGTATDKRPWIRPDGSTCFTEYVETKRQRLVDSFSAARQVLKKSATRQERGYNIHLKSRQYQPGDWVLKWYKPLDDQKLARGWIGPYVITRAINDVVYEIQSHPQLRAKTVHVDHLKPCYAWETRDNWIKNPNYKVRDRPRPDPEDRDNDLDEILSQEGEDAVDYQQLLKRRPHRPSENVSPSTTTVRMERDQVAGARLHNPVDTNHSDQAAVRRSGTLPTQKGNKQVDTRILPSPDPYITKRGRLVKPPDRYKS